MLCTRGGCLNAASFIIARERWTMPTSVCQAAVLRRSLQTLEKETKKNHRRSRHCCFAFIGNGSQPHFEKTERSSDGGEPSGTAGLPILTAIQNEGLTNTMCIVVRYFGGTKLGAGGLKRAYRGAAKEVLRTATRQ